MMIGLALFSTLSTYGRGMVPLNHAAIPAKTDDDDFLFFIFYFALIKKMTNKGVEYREHILRSLTMHFRNLLPCIVLYIYGYLS